MGSTLDNLGSLIRMPYGCGEQNMVNFVPNIHVLRYLRAVNKQTPELEDKAKRYMRAGMYILCVCLCASEIPSATIRKKEINSNYWF